MQAVLGKNNPDGELAWLVKSLSLLTLIGSCWAIYSQVSDDWSDQVDVVRLVNLLYTLLCVALAGVSLVCLLYSERHPRKALRGIVWGGLAVQAAMMWIDSIWSGFGSIPEITYLPLFGSLLFALVLDKKQTALYTGIYALSLIPTGVRYGNWGGGCCRGFWRGFHCRHRDMGSGQVR